MSRTKGLYHPFGSSPLYSDDNIYIYINYVSWEREKSLVLLNDCPPLRFTLILWLLNLGPILTGPSTINCMHIWLWWLLFYGVYLPNDLLKTIGPSIVMVTLCFVKGPLTTYGFGLFTLYWTFGLLLYDFIIINCFIVLLIKSLCFY